MLTIGQHHGLVVLVEGPAGDGAHQARLEQEGQTVCSGQVTGQVKHSSVLCSDRGFVQTCTFLCLVLLLKAAILSCNYRTWEQWA